MFKQKTKQVIIIRGLPGSGKSYYLKQLTSKLESAQFNIHSTDQYFYQEEQYNFDKTKLEQNHKLNQQAFEQSLIKQTPLVICDNTNIKHWQRKPYIQLAQKYGYQVKIISIGLINTLLNEENNQVFNDLIQRNQHGVTVDTITQMLK